MMEESQYSNRHSSRLRDGRVKQPMSNYINASGAHIEQDYSSFSAQRHKTCRPYEVPKAKKMSADKFSEVFNMELDHQISSMSFSQRRYNGFRGQTEFDKKRILVSGKNEFSIFGYENYMSDVNYELLHVILNSNEEI